MIVTDNLRVNYRSKQNKHIFYVSLANLFDENLTDKETESIFYYDFMI